MKKFVSVLLMIGMLVSVMIPAFTSSAVGEPSVSVEPNTDFYEASGSAEVTLSLKDNPGIAEMTLYVWYDSAKLAVASNTVTDEDDNETELSFANSIFNGCELTTGKSTTGSAIKKAFAAAGVTSGGSIKCAELTIANYDADGELENISDDGELATLVVNFASAPVIGDTFTYGVVVASAANVDGDDVEMAELACSGTLTAIDDPYIDPDNTIPTVSVVSATVVPGTKFVDVPIKYDGNVAPGFNFLKFDVAYTTSLNLVASTNGNIFKANEFHPGLFNDDPNKTVIKTGFDNFGIDTEGYYGHVLYFLSEDPEINITSIGTVATLRFEIPDDAANGDKYEIRLCYAAGDCASVQGTGNNTEFTDISPVVNDGFIKVECAHATTHTVTTDATCTVAGHVDVICDVCNSVVTSTPIDALGHSYTTETVDATCTVDGSVTKTCSVCGDVQTTVIPATGHDTETTVINDATCTIDGSSETKCKVCNEVISTDVIPATGHSFSNPTVVEPTCTIDGSKTDVCSVCGENAVEVIPATGHTAGEPEIVAPTCTVDGSSKTYCTVCDELLTDVVLPATGHTSVSTTTLEPTCTVDGTQETRCSVCDELLSTAVIPATGHTAGAWTQTTAPTCTVVGEDTKYCTVCNEVLETRAVAATGHTAGAWTQTTAPTCTVAGEETQYCTVCNEVLGTRPVAATGHTAGAWTQTTAPTCTVAGEETQYCTVCNEVLGTRVVAATGHTAGAWVVTTPATYTAEGVETQYCTVCNEVLGTRPAAKLTVSATVVYQLADGTKIADDSTTANLYVGDPFEATPAEIAGYTTEDTATSITLAETGNTIVFTYAPKTDLTYTIYVIDANGNKLAVDVVVTDQTMGATVVIEAPEIEGYTPVESTITIVIGADNNNVEFKYTKNVAPTDPNPTTPGTTAPTEGGNKVQTGDTMLVILAIALAAVLGCAVVIVVRRRKAHN